jgi:undecaprenyl-diphosphatase
MLLGFITKGDHRVMHRANNWPAPKWVRLWSIAATRAGDGWLWFAIGFGILLFGDDDRYAALGAGGLAGVSSVLSFMWLKRLTGRRRPCTIEPHCWATLLPPDQFSFPSGHTMTAFSVSVAICLFYPALTAGMLFGSFSIATSRVLLGMHFLSDVIAAMFIGGTLGYLAFLAFS